MTKKMFGKWKKGRMFAAAKKGSGPLRLSSLEVLFWMFLGGSKNFFKKDSKSIAGKEKGFYICTRLARKRAERAKQVAEGLPKRSS
jgi:hypothetical protein